VCRYGRLMEVLGTLFALAAAMVFGCGIVLQAAEARQVPRADARRVRLVARLARSRRWLVGTTLTLVGWLLHATAFRLAPVTIVQPALAFTLVVVLLGAHRVLDEPVGVREVAAVGGLAGGLILLIAAAPTRTTQHAHGADLAVPLVVLGIVALVPLLRPPSGRLVPLSEAVAAGIAFAWSGIATKLFTDTLASGRQPTAALWLALVAVAAVLGGVAEMSALQVGRASRVVPITFAFEIALPVALAPVLFGERWGALGAARILTLAAALTAVLAAAVILATSSGVTHLIEAEAASEAERRGLPQHPDTS